MGLCNEVIFMRSWKEKLSSRKFWACLCGVILSVMVIFGYSDEEKTKITGLIMATGTLITYILAEGNVDASSAKDDMFTSAIKQFANNSYIPPVEFKEGESVDNKG